ncbi:hypothetical protein ACLB2K_040245 [Fragaria x ananassa]
MATYRALLSLKSSLDDPDSRLSALSALRLLNLSNNVFNRTFPPELSNLTNLRVLDLYNNNLTGVLPVSVLSALNLYRYVLIAESRGKTNYTGVLSRSNLQKAYNEWLLPLRTLVTGIVAVNKNESDELAVDTLCTFNPVELVLYRCIELVEEKLKEST